MAVELRLLRYFVVVAEELNFRRAASRLHMTQPPLSRQIGELERELGTQLLRRTTRRVELTDAGRVFAREAQSILDRVEQASRLAALAEQGHIGVLRLGFVPSSVFGVLPDCLELYRQHAADVALTFSELTTDEQLSKLRADEIDVGIMRPPGPSVGITWRTFRRDPLVAVVPSKHKLARRKRLSLPELAGEPFIFLPRRRAQAFHDLVTERLTAAGLVPNVKHEVNGSHAVISLVAAAQGVSVVPLPVAQASADPRVTFVVLNEPNLHVDMAVGWREGAASKLVRGFVDSLPTVG